MSPSRWETSGLEIEQLAKERPPLFLVWVRAVMFARIGGLGCRRRRAVDDLVEFAAIKPDTPTFWTIIYLDAAAFGDHERFSVHGTLHAFPLSSHSVSSPARCKLPRAASNRQ